MNEIKRIQGSVAQAKPVVVGPDTIYVHSNIINLGNGLYEYDEVQYTHLEWIEELGKRNESMSTELLNAQLAIIELYGREV